MNATAHPNIRVETRRQSRRLREIADRLVTVLPEADVLSQRQLEVASQRIAEAAGILAAEAIRDRRLAEYRPFRVSRKA